MTSRILYLYWKILGVFPFNITEDGVIRFSYGGAIFSLILAVTYSACYFRAITGRINFALPRASPMAVIANLAGLSIEYSSLMWSWLFFGLRRKQLRRIVIRLKKINETFADHDMRADDARFFREVMIHLILMNTAWGLICTCSYLLLLHFEPWKLAMWMVLNILRIVNHSVVLMFVSAMRLIKERFRSLNQRIRYLANEDAISIAVRRKLRGREFPNYPHGTFPTLGPLEIYGRIHADLVDLTTISVEFFAIAILFAILYECMQMASGLYALCFVTKDVTWFLVPVAWSFWIGMYLSELVILVFVCDSTDKEVLRSMDHDYIHESTGFHNIPIVWRQANRTGNVLHAMLTNRCAAKYVDSAKVLSLRLLQKQLKIELFGLFRIQLDIIYRIMGLLGAYITIMIQLDNQSIPEN